MAEFILVFVLLVNLQKNSTDYLQVFFCPCFLLLVSTTRPNKRRRRKAFVRACVYQANTQITVAKKTPVARAYIDFGLVNPRHGQCLTFSVLRKPSCFRMTTENKVPRVNYLSSPLSLQRMLPGHNAPYARYSPPGGTRQNTTSSVDATRHVNNACLGGSRRCSVFRVSI